MNQPKKNSTATAVYLIVETQPERTGNLHVLRFSFVTGNGFIIKLFQKLDKYTKERVRTLSDDHGWKSDTMHALK